MGTIGESGFAAFCFFGLYSIAFIRAARGIPSMYI